MVVPDREQAQAILRSYGLPDGIVVHSEGVATVAAEAARMVAAADIPIDLHQVESAALLHDIDKLETRGDRRHGLVAAADLERLGFTELVLPVASHPLSCLLDEDRFPRGWPSVIVSIADRHVAQEFVTIDERLDDMSARYPEHAAAIDAARRPAHALERELAEAVGIDADALVARLRAAWERRS